MRLFRLLAMLPLVLAVPGLRAQELADTCHARSSYDLTLRVDGLLFDRPQPAPRQVLLHQGALQADGAAVRLNAEDRDRLALFERELRALVPRLRAVAEQGADLAAKAVRDEAAGLGLAAATREELDRRLTARAIELKHRIAVSQSTHDWQGAAFEQYADQVGAELMPLLAGDLGQQALAAAMNGDLATAASLRDRAAALATQLQPSVERRMQALRPQVQALCPAIRRLAELQDGVRDGGGRPLELLWIDNGN